MSDLPQLGNGKFPPLPMTFMCCLALTTIVLVMVDNDNRIRRLERRAAIIEREIQSIHFCEKWGGK